MSWFLTVIILSFTFHNLADAKHEKKQLPSAVVVGTVYCDTCFMEQFSKTSHFISGASVAVECGGDTSFREEVKTNEHGEFKVHLPFSVSKHVKKIKQCSVKLISSNEPYCAVASTATSSSLHLKSKKQGTHIFSAGFFTFKPLNQPDLCNQKPSIKNSKEFNSMKPFVPTPPITTFPPTIQDPPTPVIPPIDLPTLPPLPLLPPVPPLPGSSDLPIPTVPKKPTLPKTTNSLKKSQFLDQKEILSGFLPNIPLLPSPPPVFGIPNPFQPPSLLPPNPFQPPPSLIPPNPFQPQPPPSIFPPNPFQPPSSPPTFNLPTLPGLTPSSPPPPPPFTIPLPPFPFQPTPGFPGVPPA